MMMGPLSPLLCAAALIHLVNSSPLALTKRESPFMGEEEEENRYCDYDPSRNDQDYNRSPCPPGYFIPEGSLLSCSLCPFNDTVQQYNPEQNYCNGCMDCPACPEGYRVKSPCTRMKKTKCEPDIGTESTVMTLPTVSSVPPLTTMVHEIKDPPTGVSVPKTTTLEPLLPCTKQEAELILDIRQPRIYIPILTVFGAMVLVIIHCYRKNRHQKAEPGIGTPGVPLSVMSDDDVFAPTGSPGQDTQGHREGLPEDEGARESDSMMTSSIGWDAQDQEDDPGERDSMVDT